MIEKDSKKAVKNIKKDENIHKNHRSRVVNRFLKKGIDVFDDYQALEFLLFYVYKRIDTNPIAHRLLKEFKTLEGVFNAEYNHLLKIHGVGPKTATLITLVGQLRNKIKYDSQKEEGEILDNTARIGCYCMDALSELKNEQLMLICLNNERKIISKDIISKGVINATAANVRKIIEITLKTGASGIILSHNHPSGNCHPSGNDIEITNLISDALRGINVTLVDHIVCGEHDFCSLFERGLLK